MDSTKFAKLEKVNVDQKSSIKIVCTHRRLFTVHLFIQLVEDWDRDYNHGLLGPCLLGELKKTIIKLLLLILDNLQT